MSPQRILKYQSQSVYSTAHWPSLLNVSKLVKQQTKVRPHSAYMHYQKATKIENEFGGIAFAVYVIETKYGKAQIIVPRPRST